MVKFCLPSQVNHEMNGKMNTNNRPKFCFVTPMYNAATTLPTLLHSICGQSYDNWKLILIDDVSEEKEKKQAEQTILQFQSIMGGAYSEKIIDIWNEDKKWEVANVLHGISLCNDDDIVCRIDADDWLTDLDSLAYLGNIYSTRRFDAIWTAHRWAYSDKNISGPMSPGSDPYKHPWVSSHLKTFRKYLLNNVNDTNYHGENGKYICHAGDQAIMLPALHNSKSYTYIPRVMYHYSIKDTPETYQTPYALCQKNDALFLRQRGYVK